MSVLAVGISHRSAPVALLERVAVPADRVAPTLRELHAADHVREAMLLSTCNRVEVYAEVEKFHGGVQAVSETLARTAGVPLDQLVPHLYVHYEDRAVQHLLSVACGLDSMVVGEAQILGQLKIAFRTAQAARTTGRLLNELVRHALRVGKRAHTETAIDRAGQSLVSVGLDLAEREIGSLEGCTALLVGAGSMGALAGTTLRRRGVGRLIVANRTLANAERLAKTLDGEPTGLDRLTPAIADADVVVTSTGSVGLVVQHSHVQAAAGLRGGRPLFLLDLALPHDIDPQAATLDGVTVADLETLRGVLDSEAAARDVEAVRRIVTDEVTSFLSWQRAAEVAPTVVALRSKAASLVDVELDRLTARLPELDDRARREVEQTVHRVVDKLLHAPTVRVKELADEPGGDKYAAALRELFGLDPAAPEAVTRAAVDVEVDLPDDGDAS